MAFTDISKDAGFEGGFKKLTGLKVGESITGYAVGVDESKHVRAPGALSLIMRIEGKRVSVSVAGNVKWLLKDGKIKTDGPNTKITRIADALSGGKLSTKFTVEQDFADVYSDNNVGVNTLTPINQATAGASVADRIKALKQG